MKRARRTTALVAAFIAIAIVVATAIVARQDIAESWYLWRLASTDDDVSYAATEKLIELGAVDALPAIVVRATKREGFRADTERRARGVALHELPADPLLTAPIGAMKAPKDSVTMALATVLDDERAEARVLALLCLRARGSDSRAAVPRILETIRDDDSDAGFVALLTIRVVGMDEAHFEPALDVVLSAPSELIEFTGRAIAEAADGNSRDDSSPSPEWTRAIVRRLRSASKAHDRAATAALLRFRAPTPESNAALIAALDDPAFEVRKEAVLALGSFESDVERVVAPLIRALRDETAERRSSALEVLDTFFAHSTDRMPPLGVAALLDFFTTAPAADDRVRIAELLEEAADLDDAAAVRLASGLDDPEPTVRLAVARTLGWSSAFWITSDEATARAARLLPTIEAALGDETTCDAAVRALVVMEARAPSALPALARKFVDDDGPWARLSDDVVRIFGRAGPLARDAVPVLVAALEPSRPEEIRERAARALLWIGPAAGDIYEAMREDKQDDEVVDDSPIAPDPPIDLLRDRRDAIGSLAFEDQFFEKRRSEWPPPLQSDSAVRDLIASGRSLTHEEIELLFDLFTNDVPGDRGDVARALGRIGAQPVRVARLLTRALRHAEDRVACLDGLEQLGPEAALAIPTAIELLDEPRHRVREAAARLLGSLAGVATDAGTSPDAVCRALAARLADPHHAVRREAARALAEHGDDASVAKEALDACSDDRDPRVRWYAARALERSAAR